MLNPRKSRRPRKRRTTPLTAKETVRIIAQLFDRYGIDRSLDRDRSRDGERFKIALYYAAEDGLLKIPRSRGAPSIWKGKVGLELLTAVESLRIPPRKQNISKAIKHLQDQQSDKWGAYEDLEKRFYEARKAWGYGRRLMMLFDPWHKDHPYPENS